MQKSSYVISFRCRAAGAGAGVTKIQVSLQGLGTDFYRRDESIKEVALRVSSGVDNQEPEEEDNDEF